MIGLTNHIEARKRKEAEERSMEAYYGGELSDADFQRFHKPFIDALSEAATKTNDFSTITTLGKDMEIYNK